MINHVTVWIKITQYDEKRAISITNLVETMFLTRYPRPMEITYDQVSEFIGHEFRKFPIEEEYGKTANLNTSVNTTFTMF